MKVANTPDNLRQLLTNLYVAVLGHIPSDGMKIETSVPVSDAALDALLTTVLDAAEGREFDELALPWPPAGLSRTQALRPVHPGELLREEWLAESGSTAEDMARKTGIDIETLNLLLAEEAPITEALADKLTALGTTSGFWMNLQAQYDLKVTQNGA